MGNQYLLRNWTAPFGNSGKGQERNVGALQARHLVRVAQAAVSTLFVIVPMHSDNSQAQQQQEGDGASEDQLRSPVHTGPIIVLVPRRMQITGGARCWVSLKFMGLTD